MVKTNSNCLPRHGRVKKCSSSGYVWCGQLATVCILQREKLFSMYPTDSEHDSTSAVMFFVS